MVNRLGVSVICCTYNHEPYIRNALNSILEQRTNFPIEILIHDDASADNTAAIIKEYEKAFPDRIKPIYQTDNQYSKGIDVQQINYERARGKYIAICNGDDFWIDEYKLQRQYDYLEKTKHCMLSVHAGKIVDADSKQVTDICSPSKMNRFYSTPELIDGDGGLFITNSMFFRAHIVKNRPSLFMKIPVTDYVLILYLSLFGQVHYMRDVMSCHRVSTSNTSSTTQVASNKDKDKESFIEIGEWLLQFDEWTNYSFHDAIEAKLVANDFVPKPKDSMQMDEQTLQLVNGSIPFKRKVVVIFERHLPQLAGRLKRKRWLMYQLLHRRH